MRVAEATTRAYLDDEAIQDLARRMLSGSSAHGPAPIPGCSRRLAGLVLPRISGVLG